MSAATEQQAPAPEAGSGALDVLLMEAARGPVRQFLPGRAGVITAAKLASRPSTVARRGLALTAEMARIAAGRSQLAPRPKDRRFTDPAWQGNPLLRRVLQAYLAGAGTLEQLLDDANLDWREDRRMRFLVDNLVAALAPSNAPFLNPAALKAGLETGGRNYVHGARTLVRDLSKRPHIPQMVDQDAFTVGVDLAITPGQVVLRTPVFELIQYAPRAEQVHTVPVLVVPPMINKFYIADLAPGRSMVEHFLDVGLQVFAVSWRNPCEDQAGLGLDDYGGSVLTAMDALEAITGSDRTLLFALCAGGIVTSTVVAHLAATGAQDRVAGLTLGVTVLDQQHAGTVGSLVDRPTAALAAAQSSSRGYLDGRSLAGVFAWLRPDDLVWNYWVNNYLLGKKPPAFDVLYWNADTTRMPAALHRDFLRLAMDNALVRPGGATVLGTPVDLSAITVDSYNLAGIADHICPWENVYRSGRLLGSAPRFVLSTSGHIAALVNPPGNAKASYQVGEELPDDPESWLDKATTAKGSWWTDWTGWATGRAGDLRPPPEELGDADHPPLGPAPGTYVFET
jgi:polyhydroxyalkanoate synthase subunit PhaC